MEKSQKKCVVVGSAALLILGLASVWLIGDGLEKETNRNPFHPEGASDIVFVSNGSKFFSRTYTDFAISENDFISYSRRMKWKLEKIETPRKFNLSSEAGGFNVKSVDDGFFYDLVYDNGGGILVVYDRDSHRATIISRAN